MTEHKSTKNTDTAQSPATEAGMERTGTTEKKRQPKNPQLYISRELSWLNFNGRVLLEAGDPTVPVLERLNFLGIFSNNMDEFYRVRVAVLKRLANLHGEEDVDPHFDPAKILRAIHRRSLEQRSKADDVYEHIAVNLQTKISFSWTKRN